MFATYLILFLLTSEPSYYRPLPEMVGIPIQRMAVRLEILDERECRYIFAYKGHFWDDVLKIWDRLVNLYDAPPLCDAWRLPPADMLQEWQMMNRLYRERLEAGIGFYTGSYWWYKSAITDTDRLYELLTIMMVTKREYQNVSDKREALKKLRTILGEQAYYAGEWPPCVPLWCFSRVD